MLLTNHWRKTRGSIDWCVFRISTELLPCEYFAQEDSLTLWRDICGNKLLASANLILFFNKVDLWASSLHYFQFTLAQKDVLNATLAAGVSVKKFVPSYGNLPNDVPHVTKCSSCQLFYAFCSHFVSVLQISKKSSETIMLVLLSCPQLVLTSLPEKDVTYGQAVYVLRNFGYCRVIVSLVQIEVLMIFRISTPWQYY